MSRLARLPLHFAAALTSPYDPDRYLELFGPMRVQHEIRAEVVSADHQTPGTVTLTLRPTRTGRARTGHLAMHLPTDWPWQTAWSQMFTAATRPPPSAA